MHPLHHCMIEDVIGREAAELEDFVEEVFAREWACIGTVSWPAACSGDGDCMAASRRYDAGGCVR